MYCRNCGELLLEDDKFCSKCGKKVIRKNTENGVDEKDNKECENEEIKRKLEQGVFTS